MESRYTYKTVQSQLRAIFYLLLLPAVAFAMLFECGIAPKEILPQDSSTLYALQMSGVITTILLIPIALKTFTRLMAKAAKESDDEIFYKKYRRNSILRMSLTYIVLMANLLIYYVSGDNSALYCALVGLLCFIYSYPTRSTVEMYSENPDDDK